MHCLAKSSAVGGFRTTMVTSARAANKTALASLEDLKTVLVSAITDALESAEAEGLLGRLLVSAQGGLDAREQSLLGLRHLLGQALAQVCLAAETGYSGARKRCSCGRTARYVRNAAKGYVTMVGEVEMHRAEYWCSECGATRPLDEEWDLPQGHFTRAVVRLASTMGGALPFERAAEVLETITGIGISASQVRRLSERVGEEIGRQLESEMEALQNGELAHTESPSVLVVGMDGAHVNTRGEAWKETKVAVAAACEWQQGADGKWELQPVATDYAAILGSPEPFGQSAYALTQRMGGRGHERTLVVGDGAPWIWNLANEHFPEAVQVLDFYHLAEHVHGAANALFAGDEAKARDWAETILELLREDEIDTALVFLERSGAQAANLLGYVTTNRNRMPYRWLRENGYPIGSGIVESACKQIVHARHRQAGMRWDKSHAQKMLNLACCVRGKRWDAFWAAQPNVA